jgi:hypothetical protein
MLHMARAHMTRKRKPTTSVMHTHARPTPPVDRSIDQAAGTRRAAAAAVAAAPRALLPARLRRYSSMRSLRLWLGTQTGAMGAPVDGETTGRPSVVLWWVVCWGCVCWLVKQLANLSQPVSRPVNQIDGGGRP